MALLSAPVPSLHSSGEVSNRRALVSLGLGNTLEWFDWQIFGLLAAFVGPHFFPSHNSVSATLNTLAVFAVGFAFRPLGGVIFGMVADRVGRRGVMMMSIAAMAVASLVIGVIPDYKSIGIWAGVILLVVRIVQGVSAGAEAPVSTMYAVELSPRGREGRAAGVISLFVNVGILFASLVSFAISEIIGGGALEAWGWRIPFLIGAALGFVVLFMRRSLPESLGLDEDGQAPTDTASAQDAGPAKAGAAGKPEGVWGQIGRHWLGLVAIIFIVGAAQAYNYAWNVGLPSLARSSYHEDPTSVFAATSLLGLLLVLGSLAVGALADRRKLSRTFIVTRLLAVPGVFIALIYQGHGIATFTAVLLGGGVLLVMNMTLYNVVSTSLMPKFSRATGVGLGYGVGVALFGGTASYLLVWLGSIGYSWLFPVYTAVLALISVALYIAARRYSGTYAGE